MNIKQIYKFKDMYHDFWQMLQVGAKINKSNRKRSQNNPNYFPLYRKCIAMTIVLINIVIKTNKKAG